MDSSVLRKKLNTFKSGKGSLRQVSNAVVLEVLRAWENWPGTSADLYRELGLSKMQLVTMIQKAKRLVKKGTVIETDFSEIKLEQHEVPSSPSNHIELVWDQGKLIRFSRVEQLVEFLKKVA
jgi:hypothetical protein